MDNTISGSLPGTVKVLDPIEPSHENVLTSDALLFIAELTRQFRGRVETLLKRRQQLQKRYDEGAELDFLSETIAIRQGEWIAAPLPKDLLDRRVEITGPPVRKMIINALNSGAKVFMADFEDSCAPTWGNLLTGQSNLKEAVRGTISIKDDGHGKSYALGKNPATLVVRPRGWHLWEHHLRVDDMPVPAALCDFGLFFFHNAQTLIGKGSGPYFYLPKLQNHLEARLWNDVFTYAQRAQDLPNGSIRATVLIETLPAAFEMDEIIYELKDHIVGLNCGRWDYIFSFIKTRRCNPQALLPDRQQVAMTQPCMRAYSQLLVRTCHKRGIHAMGGMAAQIPIKGDAAANDLALEKVRADKLREVRDGHDGTWVAHPGLVPVAKEIFDAAMPNANQLDNFRNDVHVLADDLLRVPMGSRTLAGLRQNIEVGIVYLEAWLGGNGCVPIHHLMEDAATAEISRSQVWQWLHHCAVLQDGSADGVTLTAELLQDVIKQEMSKIHETVGKPRFAEGHFHRACELFEQWSLSPTLEEFLTTPASEYLQTIDRGI